MTTNTTVTEVAERLADTARELAHLTRPEHRADTLAHPANAYGLLAELRLAAGYLDGVCDHLAVHTLHLSTDERLHHDHHGHGIAAADNAWDAAAELDRAHRAFQRAYTALDLAQTAYAPLSLRDPGREVTE